MIDQQDNRKERPIRKSNVNWYSRLTPGFFMRLAIANVLVGAVAEGSGVSFIARRDSDVAIGPVSVAVGDFNGDGVLDLVTANYPRSFDPGTVSVQLGNGDGTFRAAVSYLVGVHPSSVAVGDFNRDGLPDLAVVSYDMISVLLGNGDGTFTAIVNYPAPRNNPSLAVSDLNGDGVPDLAVTTLGTYPSYQDGKVSVMLGNGDGTFRAEVNYDAGLGPVSVAVGDFNRDGVPDLVVANYVNFSDSVSVLLGNGDGTFRGAVDYPVRNNPLSVAVGDFNGDGVPDLAVVNEGYREDPGGVSVLLGNGDGTFQGPWNYDAGLHPSSAAVGDFDGDGVPDLAVTFHDYGVALLLGYGDGIFRAAVNYYVGAEAHSMAVGDFNRDGVPDLAVADDFSNSISVLLGNRDRIFQLAPTYPAAVDPYSVVVADFNGDGLSDLAVASSAYPDPMGTGTVSLLLGNGDGTFRAAGGFPAGNGRGSMAVGDFNGDGVPDLAVTKYYSGEVSVLLGNGDGTFQVAVNYPVWHRLYSVAVGDFNGDGLPDLAVTSTESGIPGTVWVLLGNGDGTFQIFGLNFVGVDPYSVSVGDFNGDGIPDLAVANLNSDSVSVLLGNGNGSFRAAVNYPVDRPGSVAVDDFNGDGAPDLAVVGDLGGVGVLLGNGDGTFRAAVTSPARGGRFAVGDFNGDGVLDLAVANGGDTPYLSNSVWVLLGNGDGTFQAERGFGAGYAPFSVVVGDFNRDGMTDLAVANALSSDVSVLINNTPP